MISKTLPDQMIQRLPLFILVIWVLYLVLSPFYVFPKGRPQPADFILILAVLPVMATLFMQSRGKISLVYFLGGFFVFLTIGVNVVNHLFFPDIRFLLTAMIYPYNFMVFLFTVWLFTTNPEEAKKWTYIGLVATIALQVLFVNFTDMGYRGYRGTAGFENPNQLAYWVLLTMAMLVFLRRGQVLRPTDYLLILVLGYLEAIALSKAGIITFVIFILILAITPKMSRLGHGLLIMAALCGVIYAIYDFGTIRRAIMHVELLQSAAERIEGIGTEADDSPEARGYYRIVQFPLYTVFGSGEGSFWRFNVEGYNRELHSGIATIIFSYGIFGAFLFFSFLLLIIIRQKWYYILLFVPIIMFGLPHQNFRFAHFWVFLGINYGLFLAYYREDARQRIARLKDTVLPITQRAGAP